MTNEDIIFAAIVGSKLFKTSQNLNIVQNELSKHVLPTIPFPIWNNEENIKAENYNSFKNRNKAEFPTSPDQQFFPLGFQFDENGLIWWLPYEPLISVNGKNIVDRRSVSKYEANSTLKNIEQGEKSLKFDANGFGSLKNIRPDDYEITITGILFGENEKGNADDCYPRHDLQKLVKFLTSKTHIRVYSPILELLNVNYIVIEDFSFPFTKGENTQAYEIKAISDSGKYKLEALKGTF